MPLYDTSLLPTALFKQDSSLVWNAENPASGTASERIAVVAEVLRFGGGVAAGRGELVNADDAFVVEFHIQFGDVPGRVHDHVVRGGGTVRDVGDL